MAESEKYSKKDFMRGLLVLETDGLTLRFGTVGFSKSSLKDKVVSLSVRKAFNDNNVVLSDRARVNQTKLTEWILLDQDDVYVIKKIQLSFVVYADITKLFDAGTIPPVLKTQLAANSPVDINASISDTKTNQRWVIDNGVKNLIVYKDKVHHAMPTYRVYREDFTLETDLIPGTEIVGTCFYRESPLGEAGDPLKKIFPASMTGVIFKRCNLDNVFVQEPENTIMDADGIASSHRRIRVQNDMQDWIVDADGKPDRPLDPTLQAELGLSPDPKDIPASPVEVNP